MTNAMWAQQDLKLTIISDGDRGTYEFKELVKTEIFYCINQSFPVQISNYLEGLLFLLSSTTTI